MQEEDALQFYERLTQGTDYYETIDLEHKSGSTLKGVKMHAVSKQKLASVIQELPPELIAASSDEVDNPAGIEDEVDESALAAVNENTVEAFEDLLKTSLSHDELTKPQMEKVCENLDFETMFEIGTEIIDISMDTIGQIRGFRKQG